VVGDVVTHVKGPNILPPAASGWSGNRSIGCEVGPAPRIRVDEGPTHAHAGIFFFLR
jgi:hypothetical protein